MLLWDIMMTDRIENPPSQEIMAAREALKAGMTTLLKQRRDLSFDKLVAKGCAIEAVLNFEEVNSRRVVPSSVVDFIDSQYPDRRVGLATIRYRYARGEIKDGRNHTLRTWESPVIRIKVAHLTGDTSDLERERHYEGVVIPGQDIVRSTSIRLLLYNNPMSYYVSQTSARELIAGSSAVDDANWPHVNWPRTDESRVLNPEIVLALTSLLPDQPSTTPLLDKIIDLSWLPVAIRAPLHTLRLRRLERENPNFPFSENLPGKSISIYG